MELSDEMLKIIDLIKAGQVELVEQLLIGNPEICSDSSNENTTKIFQKIFPYDSPVGNWHERTPEKDNKSSWLPFWAKFLREHPDYNENERRCNDTRTN